MDYSQFLMNRTVKCMRKCTFTPIYILEPTPKSNTYAIFPGPHTTTRQSAYLRHADFQTYAISHPTPTQWENFNIGMLLKVLVFVLDSKDWRQLSKQSSELKKMFYDVYGQVQKGEKYAIFNVLLITIYHSFFNYITHYNYIKVNKHHSLVSNNNYGL